MTTSEKSSRQVQRALFELNTPHLRPGHIPYRKYQCQFGLSHRPREDVL